MLYRGAAQSQKLLDCTNGITRVETSYYMHTKTIGDEFLLKDKYDIAIKEVKDAGASIMKVLLEQ